MVLYWILTARKWFNLDYRTRYYKDFSFAGLVFSRINSPIWFPVLIMPTYEWQQAQPDEDCTEVALPLEPTVSSKSPLNCTWDTRRRGGFSASYFEHAWVCSLISAITWAVPLVKENKGQCRLATKKAYDFTNGVSVWWDDTIIWIGWQNSGALWSCGICTLDIKVKLFKQILLEFLHMLNILPNKQKSQYISTKKAF